MEVEHVRSRFIKHFDGTTGTVYASPGRINLIGEHTDYNGGFVFPGAMGSLALKRPMRRVQAGHAISMVYVARSLSGAESSRVLIPRLRGMYRWARGCHRRLLWRVCTRMR